MTRTAVTHMNRVMMTAAFLAAFALPAAAQEVPAPGKSPRIDAIKKAGVLRVAVLANPPWLMEDTTGKRAEHWYGPGWVLAEEVAKRLGVKIKPIMVSHETKIPVLAANQVDMTITPMIQNPEREKVVDFVNYTQTSTCMFGRADNPNFTKAKTVDDLNRPDITIAYLVGGAEEIWVKKRFPKAKTLGVGASGAVAPIEEVMAHRADTAPVNRVPWVAVQKKVPGLAILPKENNCQDSMEQASPGGSTIDENQPVFHAWLIAVEKAVHDKVHASELAVVEELKNQ